MMPRQTQSNGWDEAQESSVRDSPETTDSPETEGEAPVADDPAESAEAPDALPTLDDLFAGAPGASCSIDGVCD